MWHATCEQSLHKKEQGENWEPKVVEYQKCYENMEVMKIDLTSNKGNYTVDHYYIIQEIDQVQKQQTVHKARFADIEIEVSLLKI